MFNKLASPEARLERWREKVEENARGQSRWRDKIKGAQLPKRKAGNRDAASIGEGGLGKKAAAIHGPDRVLVPAEKIFGVAKIRAFLPFSEIFNQSGFFAASAWSVRQFGFECETD